MTAERPLRAFLVAGEASGDRLGAALMRGLRTELGGAVAFSGVGGAAMAAEGLESLFPIADIAVMGVAEVAPKLRTILRRIRETTEAALAAQPDVMITIDAPDFGLRVAERARRRGAQALRVHYVAPSVWAWRPGRARKMAKRTDHLLALLPFEPPFFRREGLSCDFVGHPIVETVADIDVKDRSLRSELGIAANAPLLIALPGSRRGEIERLAGPFGDTLSLLLARRPNLRVIVPLAEQVADLARERVADWPGAPVALDPRGLDFHAAERRKLRAMAAADVALAASGTVSLELAAMRTPMAIAYRASPLTAADRPAHAEGRHGDAGQSRLGNADGAGVPSGELQTGRHCGNARCDVESRRSRRGRTKGGGAADDDPSRRRRRAAVDSGGAVGAGGVGAPRLSATAGAARLSL